MWSWKWSIAQAVLYLQMTWYSLGDRLKEEQAIVGYAMLSHRLLLTSAIFDASTLQGEFVCYVRGLDYQVFGCEIRSKVVSEPI